MKHLTWTASFILFAAAAALAQEPAYAPSIPQSEAPPAGKGPAFEIGPTAGYLKARGADKGTWLGGAQARLHFTPLIAIEGAITFHANEFSDGDIVVTQYPVQLSALLYPMPDAGISPYIIGGLGWYYTRVDYRGALSPLFDDTTDHVFGVHLGAGGEVRISPTMTINADVRYIFLDPDTDGIRRHDLDFWQATAGLNIGF